MQDIINGSFELFAGFFILGHILRLRKDKKVRGVSISAVLFMTLWGYWNLYYYPHLGQSWSFWGGIGVVTTNTVWLCQLFYYWRKEKGRRCGRCASLMPSAIPGFGFCRSTRTEVSVVKKREPACCHYEEDK